MENVRKSKKSSQGLGKCEKNRQKSSQGLGKCEKNREKAKNSSILDFQIILQKYLSTQDDQKVLKTDVFDLKNGTIGRPKFFGKSGLGPKRGV